MAMSHVALPGQPFERQRKHLVERHVVAGRGEQSRIVERERADAGRSYRRRRPCGWPSPRCRRCRRGRAARRDRGRPGSSPPTARRASAAGTAAPVRSVASRPRRPAAIVSTYWSQFSELIDECLGGQMTIFAMVRNSGSEIGRSLQRRCAIAAAPMLPASATIRAGRRRQDGQAAEGEIRVAAPDRVDRADAERRQREALFLHAHHRAVGAVGDRQAVGAEQTRHAIDQLREGAAAVRGDTARLRSDSGCSSRRRRIWSAGCSRSCSS